MPLYKINRYVEETGELFEDDAQIIYVNGKNMDSSTGLGRLMQDFLQPDSEKMNYKLLSDNAKKLKNDREDLVMFREFLTEEEWNMAIKEGNEQGEKRKALKTALLFLSLGKNTNEDIANCTGLSIEEVNKLAGEVVK